ncbi:hypothetical protein ID866_10593 [Astraeus odoratus]|nr:hypothetical protein ID866_10593 [Astraeus odoratus]
MQASSLNSIPYPALQATAIATAIYNTSTTPSHLPWDTYNYCNAPHVNADHYSFPHPSDFSVTSLAFVVMIMRHHKRTPDNLYPSEGSLNPHGGWDCSDVLTHSYAGPEVPYIYTQTSTPADHPFAERMWAGMWHVLSPPHGRRQCGWSGSGCTRICRVAHAIRSFQDFWGVYHSKLGFLEDVSPEEIYVRTSNEARTHHVAGAMLYGMDPDTAGRHWPVHTQPANIDSLVPSYVCPAAGNLRAAIEAMPEWKDHLVRYESLQRRLDATLGTSGMEDWNSWCACFPFLTFLRTLATRMHGMRCLCTYLLIHFPLPSYRVFILITLFHITDDHFFDSFTSRTCHGHPLPCNTSGVCITPQDADTVFAIGDWEYKWVHEAESSILRFDTRYIFNAAPQAHEYVQLTFGVFFAELVHTFQSLPSLWHWNGGPISHVASGTEDCVRRGSAIFSNPSMKRNASNASGAETASKHKVHMTGAWSDNWVSPVAGYGKRDYYGGEHQSPRVMYLFVAFDYICFMLHSGVATVWLATTADDNDQPFVRVLHEGSPVPPPLDWIPLDEFVRLLEHIVPHDLKGACMEVE